MTRHLDRRIYRGMNATNTNSGLVGKVVQDTMGSGIWGTVLSIKPDGWAVVKGPGGRIDEIQASRLVVDPT